MIYNNVIAREVAEYLLEIKAVVLNSSEPFTWNNGLKSPIYCDNRKTLWYPKVRNLIKTAFVDIITEEFKECDVIAGVATGGISYGVLVADILSKPFIDICDKTKNHGFENQIEGKIDAGQKAIVIEDLISTGGSSLRTVEALRSAGANVLGLGAIFTYGFPSSIEAFKAANCMAFTLSDYPTLIETALKNDYVKQHEKEALLKWHQQPETWPG